VEIIVVVVAHRFYLTALCSHSLWSWTIDQLKVIIMTVLSAIADGVSDEEDEKITGYGKTKQRNYSCIFTFSLFPFSLLFLFLSTFS